jgi:flagellar L-ring protein FlgH
MKRTLGVLLTLAISVTAFSATIWKERNIYKAGDDLKAGDVIVVRVDDISRMRFNMTMNSKSGGSISNNPDVNITGFLPKISSDKKTSTNDTTELSSKGDLAIDIAAQITAKNNDGTWAIRGIKEYSFNGVANRFEVSGSVDSALLNGRMAKSSDVVNFRLLIATTKQGIAMNLQRPPLKENETPKAELTQEEKQKIILDYLNKMLSELTR